MAMIKKSAETRVARERAGPVHPEPKVLASARPVTVHRTLTRSSSGCASGVKMSTPGTAPSGRGRKAHRCSLTGGAAGVLLAAAEVLAEDAPSTLTGPSTAQRRPPNPPLSRTPAEPSGSKPVHTDLEESLVEWRSTTARNMKGIGL